MKQKAKNLIIYIVLLLSSIMIIGAVYYSIHYPDQNFDQILYYLLTGVENTAPVVVNNVIYSCSIPVILLSILLYMLTHGKEEKKHYLIIKTKKRKGEFQIYPINIIIKHRAWYTAIVFLIAFITLIFGFKVDKYIKDKIKDTTIYEQFYVDRRDIKLSFPEKKRNLILIIAESIENTVLSQTNGGAWEYSLIPELEQLALENTNFSHSDQIGGFYQVNGTQFSAGGITAITAGIPLSTDRIFGDVNEYKGDGSYLNGAYSMGEVLKEEGYNLEVIMGSDATFGGRRQYFKTNGDYKIYDLNYAIEQGKMTIADKVWWGFEDDKLFEWSKEEITTLAKQDNPFNYVMITADTHFTDGYLSPKAENKFESQYENVHAYSSKCIYEFVKWVQAQEFYKNTTIVIIGDHLGMQNDFYTEKANDEYLRTVYNTIINPAIEPTNNNNRIFTTIDMYPTILASIGIKIEGEKLGLGTNLYSGIPTISEELGYEYISEEVKKYSEFYNKRIITDNYTESKIHSEGDVENE